MSKLYGLGPCRSRADPESLSFISVLSASVAIVVTENRTSRAFRDYFRIGDNPRTIWQPRLKAGSFEILYCLCGILTATHD